MKVFPFSISSIIYSSLYIWCKNVSFSMSPFHYVSLSLCLPFSMSPFLYLSLSLSPSFSIPSLSISHNFCLSFCIFLFSTSTYLYLSLPLPLLFYLLFLYLSLSFFKLLWLFKENGLSKVERMMIILSSPDSVMKSITQNIHRILID